MSAAEQLDEVVLYDYWRSSASYRARIALNLLGLDYRIVPVDLLNGEHREPEHISRNPQGLVPALLIDGELLGQSLAMIEYLDETQANAGLLPEAPLERARVRQVSHAIAMDIHPICNMQVSNRVVELTNGGNQMRVAWMHEYIGKGLDAVEALLAKGDTDLCFGERPGMADCCLVPQLYNARRWECDVGRWPRLTAIEGRCNALEPFARAHPDKVRPD